MLIVALLLTVASVECFSYKREFKVHNGEPFQFWGQNRFDFLVLISGNHSCTGCLFNQKTVISSGNCFLDRPTQPTLVAIEFLSPAVNNGTFRKIDRVYVHERYINGPHDDDILGDDISVVKLKFSLLFNKYSHSKFRPSTVTPTVGTEIILAGYGLDSTAEEPSLVLKTGVAVISACRKDPGDQRICATGLNKISSQHYDIGDSGAPLIIEGNRRYSVSGFYSGTIGYENEFAQMVFASFDRHKTFIRESADKSTNMCKGM